MNDFLAASRAAYGCRNAAIDRQEHGSFQFRRMVLRIRLSRFIAKALSKSWRSTEFNSFTSIHIWLTAPRGLLHINCWPAEFHGPWSPWKSLRIKIFIGRITPMVRTATRKWHFLLVILVPACRCGAATRDIPATQIIWSFTKSAGPAEIDIGG